MMCIRKQLQWTWPFYITGILFVVLAALAELSLAKSSRKEITVRVAAGAEDCYFIPNVTTAHEIDFDFQVTDASGPTGSYDITFRVLNPDKRILYTEVKSSSGNYYEEETMDGDYQFCLDNTFSLLSEKTVFMDIGVRDTGDFGDMGDYYGDYLDEDAYDEMREYDDEKYAFETFSNTTDPLRKVVSSIQEKVRRVSYHMALMAATMTQDMKMVESNGEKITGWSVLHLSMVLAIGLIQVGMIKSLFSDKEILHRLWRTVQGRSSR